ncbi:MAG: 16S rRNA (guanine(527)-N(7))-methyltransferase RsmG [Bacilli bacterium]|nr:16S rRNA (guanine(527)-N(7))-methyltransferase RsmG [Bacilli bacterium]
MTYEEMVSLLSGKIELNEKTVERFKKYAGLLKEWNEKMNLTAITDEPEIVEKHFYDCLLPTDHDLLDDKLICDLGTGAGFPGMVWAIAYPKCVVTLVDATGKKCMFLNEVIKELNLTNAFVVNSRGEDLDMREHFDIVTARAVAPLNILLEVCVPLIKEKGLMIAMKGAKGKEELADAKKAVQKLYLKVININEQALPNDEGVRYNIILKKEKKTEKKYPRSWAEIQKKPL